jgi:hypothetical protein
LTLRNNGNVETSYTLEVIGDLSETTFVSWDKNDNGKADLEDLRFASGQPGHLAYAGFDSLLLAGPVSIGVAENTIYRIRLTANAVDADATASAEMLIHVNTAPKMQVRLSATSRKLTMAQPVNVTSVITNTGSEPLWKKKVITVDGVQEQTTLLRYRIPDNLNFVSNLALPDRQLVTGRILYSTNEDGDFQYRLHAPDAEIREIALALDKPLGPGESLSMAFALILSDQPVTSEFFSRAEAFDSTLLLPVLSNVLNFNAAGNSSPDIIPVIAQPPATDETHARRVEIRVKNSGVSGVKEPLKIRGQISAVLDTRDVSGKNWQCSVNPGETDTIIDCVNLVPLRAGGTTPPVVIALHEQSCIPDRKIQVAVSVADEAPELTGNNGAEAALLCKHGTVISGRAWIDGSNDGVYQPEEEVLPGWRAQLMRAGKVVKEAATDQLGQYRMKGVLPASGYSLRFLSPQGRVEAPPLDSRDAEGRLVIEAARDFSSGTLVYQDATKSRIYPNQDLALLPTGVIFNAETSLPIANVKVTIQGPTGFVPRRHLVGPGSNVTTTTDAQGRYNFFLTPDAPGGIYHWVVDAPGFEVPSDDAVLDVAEALAPTASDEVRAAYKVFDSTAIPSAPKLDGALKYTPSRTTGYLTMNRVQGAKKVVNNHLGLNPKAAISALTLQKTADRAAVELIDLFHYTLKISHNHATPLAGFVIDDSLPRGLRYVTGSARLMNGKTASVLPDPIIRQGDGGGVSALHFDFSSMSLQAARTIEVRYRVAVGATAPTGQKVTSYAVATAGIENARASVAIRIAGGVFSDDAFVLGKVFLDCNGDGLQGDGEQGVPGVRIYLEDGAFAETDRNGKYSLYGLKPSTHILKMDPLTLPASASAIVLSGRHAGRGDLRFLDLHNGELGRGDFALTCNASVLAEVFYRREQLSKADDELDRALKLRFDAEVKSEELVPVLQADRASGWVSAVAVPELIGSVGALPAPIASGSAETRSDKLVAAAESGHKAAPSLDRLLRGDTALRIVNLKDGQILASNFTDITVLGHNRADFILTVNDEVVTAQQVGQRSALGSRQAAAWTFIAVRLHPGRNTITLSQANNATGGSDLRGYDAQSSSKLYLRIDKERSYLLLGDFNTGQNSSARQLTQYSRAVNGVRHHVEQGPVSIDMFASHDNLRQQVIQISADNTRYYPGIIPAFIVEGSERVELVTGDRAQGGIGQRVKLLARFSDYTIDELSGSLLVTDAVSRIDPLTGGQNSYRITFEVEDGTAQSWLYGADVAFSPNADIRLGAMGVNDANPNQPRHMQGVYGSWRLTPELDLDGEIAQTFSWEDITGNRAGDSHLISGKGTGWRIGARQNGRRLQSELAIISTTDSFSNLSAPIAGGRFELRAKGVYRIDDASRVKFEVLDTRDTLAAEGRYNTGLTNPGGGIGRDDNRSDSIDYTGVMAGIEQDLGHGVKLEVGTRLVRGAIERRSAGVNTEGDKAALDLITLRVRLGSTVPGLPKANVYADYEQDVRQGDKRALAIGADYALPNKGRLYARHELISSVGSAYEIEETTRSYRTLLGIEGDYMEGGQAFSEYRGDRPLTGRGPETAYGTRNRWQINEQMTMRTSIERTSSISGSGDTGSRQQTNASTGSGVVEYRYSRQLKGTAGLDVRLSDADTSYLMTFGVGYRLNAEWTLLGKNALYLVRGKGQAGSGRDLMRSRQRIGAAFRQVAGNNLNALGYYEHRSLAGNDNSVDDEATHIVSLHVNLQPARGWETSARYAGKMKTIGGVNGHSGLRGHLLSGRVTHDIGKRWDVGLAASIFADSLSQRKQAIGVEAGYRFKDDLWLSLGYNAVGFIDRDFAGMAETTQGVYFRIRYKFDETVSKVCHA